MVPHKQALAVNADLSLPSLLFVEDRPVTERRDGLSAPWHEGFDVHGSPSESCWLGID
jgi:hypothetical protein